MSLPCEKKRESSASDFSSLGYNFFKKFGFLEDNCKPVSLEEVDSVTI